MKPIGFQEPPANFGEQLLTNGGLPKELQARIDARNEEAGLPPEVQERIYAPGYDPVPAVPFYRHPLGVLLFLVLCVLLGWTIGAYAGLVLR